MIKKKSDDVSGKVENQDADQKINVTNPMSSDRELSLIAEEVKKRLSKICKMNRKRKSKVQMVK